MNAMAVCMEELLLSESLDSRNSVNPPPFSYFPFFPAAELKGGGKERLDVRFPWEEGDNPQDWKTN